MRKKAKLNWCPKKRRRFKRIVMETDNQEPSNQDETEVLVESADPTPLMISTITSEAVGESEVVAESPELPDDDEHVEINETMEVPQCPNPLQCRYCGKVFTRSFYRKEHERIHTGEKPFSCSFCAKRFNSQGSCRKHERTHMRSKSRTHECEHCGKNFKDMTTLRTHLRTHTGDKPYSCDVCGRSFSFETVLKKHMMFHNGQKQFQCMVCSKSYFTAYDLRVHVRSHTGEKPYKCRFCSQSFATGRRRNLHEKCHEKTGAHHCKQCGMIFRSVESLALHQVKSQLAGGCSYINNTHQNNTNEGATPEPNHYDKPNEQNEEYNHYNGLNENEEFDIEFLGQTIHDSNPFGSPNTSQTYEVHKTNIYPTGLLKSNERCIKKEPISDHEVYNNEEYYESMSARRSIHPIATVDQSIASSQMIHSPVQSRNFFDRPVPEPQQLSVISTDEKSVQTIMLSDTDKLFCDMETAGKVHECKHCRIIFREYSMYLVHKTLHINPVKPFVCHLCGNEAENGVDFNAHLIWHMK
ncbi:zinc finger protein 14-like isoform X2 [Mytilus trossulus]|uniref:zinc finger protein 14-like isoform X2 n=1 Tax=Mytilus trossulus TaxID=6551 RepID=UPI00300609F6